MATYDTTLEAISNDLLITTKELHDLLIDEKAMYEINFIPSIKSHCNRINILVRTLNAYRGKE